MTSSSPVWCGSSSGSAGSSCRRRTKRPFGGALLLQADGRAGALFHGAQAASGATNRSFACSGSSSALAQSPPKRGFTLSHTLLVSPTGQNLTYLGDSTADVGLALILAELFFPSQELADAARRHSGRKSNGGGSTGIGQSNTAVRRLYSPCLLSPTISSSQADC